MSWAVGIAVVVRLGTAYAQEAQPPVAQAQAPTRATIVSTGSEQWDVVVDDQTMCSTPCTGPLFPQQLVVLQSRERRPVLLEVGHLPAGDLVVSAKPHQSGRYAGGVVATSLGGMAIAVGVTLVSVGLAKDRDGMTLAGLISGGAGVLTLPYGIYLMVTAVPTVSVDRAVPGGPGVGLAGTF